MLKKVLLAVTNDLETDQRVNRAAQTLIEAGYKVTVIGRKLHHSKPFDRVFKIKRFQLFFKRSLGFYAEYNIRLFIYLLFHRFDIVYANDIDTLLPCWLAACIKRKKIIFDSHELFSEVPELHNRPRVKHIWKRLEDLLIPKIDVGITVCAPIAEFYEREYHKKFHVILNVPFPQIGSSSGMSNFNDEIRIIYQGAINKGRGLFLLVDSLEFIPNAYLIICGIGDEFEALREYTAKKDYAHRIHLMGKVAYENLPQITRTAHVGVSLEEDIGLNYRFASPNKLFDYIQAQIPVVVSNLPVMASIVREYQIGEVLYQRTPKDLSVLIKKVAHDFKNGHYINSLTQAASIFHWGVEKKKFLHIFASLESKIF